MSRFSIHVNDAELEGFLRSKGNINQYIKKVIQLDMDKRLVEIPSRGYQQLLDQFGYESMHHLTTQNRGLQL
jgi:hypothetical protein